MKIGQIKQAITDAVAFGDRKRSTFWPRTALNDLSIHAFKALCDVLPTHKNDLSDPELSTILGQVGYIFVKQYPVTAGSPADEAWGYFLKQLIILGGRIRGAQTADDSIIATTVATIKNYQRQPSADDLNISTLNGCSLIVKAAALNPGESIVNAQTLPQQIEDTLKSYYKRKNTSKINPAIVALEKLNLELMGQILILSSTDINVSSYKARIVEIFTISHPVKRGTFHNDASYNAWLTLLPKILPGQAAQPREIHQTLSTSQLLRKASSQNQLTYASIQTALISTVKVMPPVASASYGLSYVMSCLFGCWSSTQSKVSVTETDSIHSLDTARNSEAPGQAAKQTFTQRLGFTGEHSNIDIWQDDTDFDSLTDASFVSRLDASKLRIHYAKWQDLALAINTLWPAMIDGLKANIDAFKDQDAAFKKTLIQQWPNEHRGQLLEHVDTWENLSLEIYKALGQKCADLPDTFKDRPEAFQVTLVQHWPLEHSTALFQHTAQWHTEDSRPASVTEAIEQFIGGQIVIIQKAEPQGLGELLTRVNTWYPDIGQAPAAIMPALIEKFRAHTKAFTDQSEAFKVALIEQWPADRSEEIDTLLTHISAWIKGDDALPGVIADALRSKIEKLDGDNVQVQTVKPDLYQRHLQLPNDAVLKVAAIAVFSMPDFIQKLSYTTPQAIDKSKIKQQLIDEIGKLRPVQRGCALAHIEHIRRSKIASGYFILDDARRERSLMGGINSNFNPPESEKTLKAVVYYDYTAAQNKPVERKRLSLW